MFLGLAVDDLGPWSGMLQMRYDVHFHPVEPRSLRLTLSANF